MRRFLATLVLLCACGGDKSAAKDKGPPDAALPKLEMPAIGVAKVTEMNYVYGDGAKPYEPVLGKNGQYAKKDWAGVKASCEAALAKDPKHLDAHRLLGTALAQLGDFEAATPHLVAALAGDFLRWGPGLPQDKELEDYLKSPQGQALLKLHLEMKAQVEAHQSSGVWVLGRRSSYKRPSKSGGASSRGELYAWNEDNGRFLRLTHTNHQLVAWLPSPGGDELALVGFDKAELPSAKDKNAPPLIQAWVETVDARTFEVRTTKATFKKLRGVAVSFGAGGQVLVEKLDAAGRWGTTPGKTYSIDASTGKTAEVMEQPDPQSARAVVTLDETLVSGPAVGIKTTPSPGDPSLITEITIESTSRTISLPGSGLGDASVPRANHSGARVAFATWIDPCADTGPKPTLYIADANTGENIHVLSAASRFNVRWLTDDRLIYEDDEGGLRIYDVPTKREVARLEAKKIGYALSGLSPSPKPICRKEPLADVVVDDGAEEPMPPEEGVEPGPATTP